MVPAMHRIDEGCLKTMKAMKKKCNGAKVDGYLGLAFRLDDSWPVGGHTATTTPNAC